MGIMIKLPNRDPMVLDGDQITYAEGGNVLEVLNEDEEIIGAFRNWEYAIVQEPDEGWPRRSTLELDDEEDEEYDEDEEDLESEEGDEETEEVVPEQRGPIDVEGILASLPALPTHLDPGPDPWGGANLEPSHHYIVSEDGVPTN